MVDPTCMHELHLCQSKFLHKRHPCSYNQVNSCVESTTLRLTNTEPERSQQKKHKQAELQFTVHTSLRIVHALRIFHALRIHAADSVSVLLFIFTWWTRRHI